MMRRKTVSFVGVLRKSKSSVETTIPKHIVDLLALDEFIQEKRSDNEKPFANFTLEVLT